MALGDGALGFFDASHADDPAVSGRVWRAYSAVDVFPTYGWGAVSTRVARSDNNATSFTDVGLLNVATELGGGFAYNHEVPTLVYDVSASASRRWKLIWLVAFNNQAVPGDAWAQYDWTLSWFAMAAAPSPDGAWSIGETFLSGTLHNHSVGGTPRFSSPAALASEPAAFPTSDGFWLAYQATEVVIGTSSIRLLKIVSDATIAVDHGVLLDATDLALLARASPSLFSNAAYFAAPFFFSKAGKLYLGVTPASASHLYLGVAIFELQPILHGLSAGRLPPRRRVGKALRVVRSRAVTRTERLFGMTPRLVKSFTPATFHSGAGAYSERSTGSGVVTSDLSLQGSPPVFHFALTATQVQAP